MLAESLLGSPRASRTWTMRDENHQHHHGIVRLSESPLVLELRWKPDTKTKARVVGTYRLDLPELLAAGYIRVENEAVPADEVRLRFHRGPGGVISIQVRSDSPALPVSKIDL